MESKKPPGRKAYLNEDKKAKFLTFLSYFILLLTKENFKKKKPFSLKKSADTSAKRQNSLLWHLQGINNHPTLSRARMNNTEPDGLSNP